MTENKRFVRIHISDTLYTTVPYDDCFWDKETIYIECPWGVKTYPRSSVQSIEIFET